MKPDAPAGTGLQDKIPPRHHFSYSYSSDVQKRSAYFTYDHQNAVERTE